MRVHFGGMLFALALLPDATASRLFDACLAAHRRHAAFSVAIDTRTRAGREAAQFHAKLAIVPPASVRLSLDEPAHGRIAASHRLFTIAQGKFYAYDGDANELAVRVAPAGSLTRRIASMIGPLDDSIAVQADPAALARLFAPLRPLGGWKVATSRGVTLLSRAQSFKGKRTNTVIGFDTGSMRLRSVEIEVPASTLRWSFNYGAPPRTIAFVPPRNARRVAALTVRARPPRFEDENARRVVSRALAAAAGLRHSHVTVTTFGRTSEFWVDGEKYRERQSNLQWTYARGVLTIHDAHGTTFRGPAKRLTVLECLGTLRAPMTPFLRALLYHQNPVGNLLGPDLRVRSAGVMTLGGSPCDVVEMRALGGQISMVVRKDNGLVVSLMSKNSDAAGRVIGTSERQFRYDGVGHSPPAKAFVLSGKGRERSLAPLIPKQKAPASR